MLVYSEIKVLNSEFSEFNLKRLRVKTRFKLIVFCCVSDIFQDTFNWMEDYGKDSLVVIWNPMEVGCWDQSWIDRLNAKVCDRDFEFVYITGAGPDANLSEFFNIKFDYKYLSVFDTSVVDLWNVNTNNIPGPLDIWVHKYKKFTFLNRKDAVHRRYILSRLHQSKLIDDGVISFQLADNSDIFLATNDLTTSSDFTDSGLEYIKMQCENTPALPIYIEDDQTTNSDNYSTSACNTLLRNTHHNTYVSIVSETFLTYPTDSFKQTFITEKTFNSIASNQIFFIAGHPHSLELLKKLGYKTFGSIIDESYDNIISHQERLFAVTREITRFLNRPEGEIATDYANVVSIIEHNRDLLFSQNLKYKMQQFFDIYFNQ